MNRPPFDALAVAFNRCMQAVGAIDVDRRVVAWANPVLQLSLGCDEHPALDLAEFVRAAEYELERQRFDRFVDDRRAYSWVRTVRFGGEWVTVQSWLWPLGEWDGVGSSPRLAGFMSEVFLPVKGQSLGAWLDDWPQPCALVHRRDGVRHLNTRLRSLLEIPPGPLADTTRAELRAIAKHSGTNRLYESPADDEESPAVVRAERFGRLRDPVLVARVPLPVGTDPDLVLIVGLALEPASDRSASWSAICAKVGLSPREGEIAQLLLAGHRVGTIAEALGRSPHTIRNHLRSMFVKTRTSSQAELLAYLRGDVPE